MRGHHLKMSCDVSFSFPFQAQFFPFNTSLKYHILYQIMSCTPIIKKYIFWTVLAPLPTGRGSQSHLFIILHSFHQCIVPLHLQQQSTIYQFISAASQTSHKNNVNTAFPIQAPRHARGRLLRPLCSNHHVAPSRPSLHNIESSTLLPRSYSAVFSTDEDS